LSLFKIKEVDDYLGNLIAKMNELNIYKNTNIIIVSDHGMAVLKQENIIKIQDYVNISLIDINRSIFGIVSHIRTIPGQVGFVNNSGWASSEQPSV
jgi:predicted AlkP superfamily pyrophosphatase or phosphodiesterase